MLGQWICFGLLTFGQFGQTCFWSSVRIPFVWDTLSCTCTCHWCFIPPIPSFKFLLALFTQVVWKNTKSVACAYAANAKGNSYFSCEYDPAGNMNTKEEFRKNVLKPKSGWFVSTYLMGICRTNESLSLIKNLVNIWRQVIWSIL